MNKMVETEYDVFELPGKHGKIKLHVPKREPTQEEIDELHRAMAEVSINIARSKK